MKVIMGLFLSLLTFSVSSHQDLNYLYQEHSPRHFPDWMSELDNNTRLRDINIPGTHNSASLYGGHIVITQKMSIEEQLLAGVRFLDIRLRQTENVLAVHHGPVFQRQMFGDILHQVGRFLYSYPTETVLIRIRNEYRGKNNSEPFCDTFARYFSNYYPLFWQGSEENPTISQLRGKIVILENFARKTNQKFGLPYGSFSIQDKWKMDSNWSLYSKWSTIKQQLIKANQDAQSTDHRGVINYLSASVGSFPYFVASGHSSPETDSQRLWTGFISSQGDFYPDFPRVDCWGDWCAIVFEGTNILTQEYLANNDLNYVGIIAADFPGPDLIETIIRLNFH